MSKEGLKNQIKKSYHKEDNLNEYRDIAATSRNVETFENNLVRAGKASEEKRHEFWKKYGGNVGLTKSEGVRVFFDEVKESIQ